MVLAGLGSEMGALLVLLVLKVKVIYHLVLVGIDGLYLISRFCFYFAVLYCRVYQYTV